MPRRGAAFAEYLCILVLPTMFWTQALLVAGVVHLTPHDCGAAVLVLHLLPPLLALRAGLRRGSVASAGLLTGVAFTLAVLIADYVFLFRHSGHAFFVSFFSRTMEEILTPANGPQAAGTVFSSTVEGILLLNTAPFLGAWADYIRIRATLPQRKKGPARIVLLAVFLTGIALANSAYPSSAPPSRTVSVPSEPPVPLTPSGRYSIEFAGTLPRPPQTRDTTPYAAIRYVSPDGNTVAGWMEFNIGAPDHSYDVDHAFVWTAKQGLTDIGALFGRDGSQMDSVTPDGSALIGTVSNAYGSRSFCWTHESGILPNTPQKHDPGDGGRMPAWNFQDLLSWDGKYVYGHTSRGQMFRWSSADGKETLVLKPDSTAVCTEPEAISSVHNVLVGGSPLGKAVRCADEKCTSLPSVGDHAISIAHGVSDDGRWAAGESDGDLILWNPNGPVEDLGPLTDKDIISPHSYTRQTLYQIARNGSAILGKDRRSDIFLWQRGIGIRWLNAIVEPLLVSRQDHGRPRSLEAAGLSSAGDCVHCICRDNDGNLTRWDLRLR